MSDDFEQIKLDSYEVSVANKKVNQIEHIVAEVFQDVQSIDSIKRDGYKPPGLPQKVKKGRSHLLDEVISTKTDIEGEILIEEKELSEVTQQLVSSRISLTFNNAENGSVTYSRVLSNFDREVIDAVSSLAAVTQIMTAATIYRVITGKDESSVVNKSQRKKVEDSMIRCASCNVTIDITSHLGLENLQENEKLEYTGAAITFTSIKHKVGRGSTVYYKIFEMPPFFKFAEKLGKVVIIPLKLLDSPVSKTDSIIAMQSFLLREIDSMKIDHKLPKQVRWEDLYQLAYQEGKQPSRHERMRTREIIQQILDFWKKEEFIQDYNSDLKTSLIILVL